MQISRARAVGGPDQAVSSLLRKPTPTSDAFTAKQRALVSDNMEHALRIANAIVKTNSAMRWVDEMHSAALEGLCRAALSFDESYGVPFKDFAKRRIDGAVRDELRRFAHHRHAPEIKRPTPMDISTLPDNLVPQSTERAERILHDERRVAYMISQIRHPDARKVAAGFWMEGRMQKDMAGEQGVSFGRISHLWIRACKDMRELIESEMSH